MTAHPALLRTLTDHGWRRWIDTIQCCDALDLLRALPDACVDMVLSDMPYNTTDCTWESAIDLEAFWLEVKRIIKPSSPVVLTGSQPFTTDLIMSNRAWFRYEWIWEKTLATGYLNANRNPMKAHENVLVFYDSLGVYNPQMTAGKAYSATRGAVGGHVRDKTVGGWKTQNNGDRFPRSVFRFPSVINPVHPTQKPTALFEYLIRTYTEPGALVVDPFVGSGTTAISARNLNRRFICGDLSPEYVQIARARLALPWQPALFG